MKILHLIASLDPMQGGTVSYVRALAAAQRAVGDEPTIVTLDRDEAGEQPPVDAPRVRLPSRPSVYRYSEEFMPWLEKQLPSFDSFIIHGLWQYHGYGAWRVLRRARRPYLIFPHGMLDPWFKQAYPIKHLKKWLYWPWAEYRILRDAARVVFTSEEERRLARQTFALYRAREAVVALGIPDSAAATGAERMEFEAAFPETRGRRLFLFLGRLHSKKGCDLLLEAFAEVCSGMPDTVLMMAGPADEWGGRLKAQAATLGIGSRVLWPGMLQGALKRAALAGAELFLLPSHQENFGIAVVEALAAGTPVLISDKVNIWREIEADGAGLICHDTRDGIVHALRQWETLSPSARSEMRVRARAAFLARYRIEASADHLRQVIAVTLD